MKKSSVIEKIRTLVNYIDEYYTLDEMTSDEVMYSVVRLLEEPDYEKMEELYREGYASVSKADIGDVTWWYSMALGGLLLTSYGISEAEFIEWVNKQNKEENIFLMLLLSEELLEEIPEELDESIGNYFWNLLQNYKVDLSDRPWAKIVEKKENDTTFRILDRYISYDKLFIDYCKDAKYRENLEKNLIVFFEEKIDELENMPSKGGENFAEALTFLAESIMEGIEQFHVSHLSYFRGKQIDIKKISSFQNCYNEIIYSFKEELNTIITKIADLYIENYPQGGQRDHRYIDTVNNIYMFRRAIDLPYDGVGGLMAQTTNVVLRDMQGEIAKGVADFFLDIADRISFEEKIDKLFSWEFWEDQLENIAHKVSKSLEDIYFDTLGDKNYDRRDQCVFDYYLSALVPESKGGGYKEVSEKIRKDQIIELALDFPCYSEVYSLIIFLYGYSKDVEELVSLIIDEEDWFYGISEYEEMFAEYYFEDLLDADQDDLFERKKIIDEYLLEQGKLKNPEEVYSSKLRLLVHKLNVYDKIFESWKSGYKMIQETCKEVQDVIIQMDDNKLFEMVKNQNGYAFYFLKEILNRNGTAASIYYKAKQDYHNPLSKYIVSYANQKGRMSYEEVKEFSDQQLIAPMGDYAVGLFKYLKFSDEKFLESEINLDEYEQAWDYLLYAESRGYLPAFIFHYSSTKYESYGFESQKAIQDLMNTVGQSLGINQ